MNTLIENSLYNNDKEKAAFIKNDTEVAEAFAYSFIATLAIFNGAKNNAKILNYLKSDGKLRLFNISDTNNDTSLSLKHIFDKGWITKPSADNLTRFLAKMKTGGVDSISDSIFKSTVIDSLKPEFFTNLKTTTKRSIKKFSDGEINLGQLGYALRSTRANYKSFTEFSTISKGSQFKDSAIIKKEDKVVKIPKKIVADKSTIDSKSVNMPVVDDSDSKLFMIPNKTDPEIYLNDYPTIILGDNSGLFIDAMFILNNQSTGSMISTVSEISFILSIMKFVNNTTDEENDQLIINEINENVKNDEGDEWKKYTTDDFLMASNSSVYPKSFTKHTEKLKTLLQQLHKKAERTGNKAGLERLFTAYRKDSRLSPLYKEITSDVTWSLNGIINTPLLPMSSKLEIFPDVEKPLEDEFGFNLYIAKKYLVKLLHAQRINSKIFSSKTLIYLVGIDKIKSILEFTDKKFIDAYVKGIENYDLKKSYNNINKFASETVSIFAIYQELYKAMKNGTSSNITVDSIVSQINDRYDLVNKTIDILKKKYGTVVSVETFSILSDFVKSIIPLIPSYDFIDYNESYRKLLSAEFKKHIRIDTNGETFANDILNGNVISLNTDSIKRNTTKEELEFLFSTTVSSSTFVNGTDDEKNDIFDALSRISIDYLSQDSIKKITDSLVDSDLSTISNGSINQMYNLRRYNPKMLESMLTHISKDSSNIDKISAVIDDETQYTNRRYSQKIRKSTETIELLINADNEDTQNNLIENGSMEKMIDILSKFSTDKEIFGGDAIFGVYGKQTAKKAINNNISYAFQLIAEKDSKKSDEIYNNLPTAIKTFLKKTYTSKGMIQNELNNGMIQTFESEIKPKRLKEILAYNDIDYDALPTSTVRFSKKDGFFKWTERVKEEQENGDSIFKSVDAADDNLSEFDKAKLSKALIDDHYAGKHGDIFPMVTKSFSVSLSEDDYEKFFESETENGTLKQIIPAFHGTGGIAANMILRFGFRILSATDASVVGRALKDGIYFSNMIDKATQYVGNKGFSRRYGTKGFIFHMESILGKRGEDFDQAGVDKTDKYAFLSPEWAVRNARKQLKILKAYEVELVSPRMFRDKTSIVTEGVENIMSFKHYLKEDKLDNIQPTTTFIFTGGLFTTYNKKGEKIDVNFSDFKKTKFPRHIHAETSHAGVEISFKTKESDTYTLYSTTDMPSRIYKLYADLWEKR